MAYYAPTFAGTLFVTERGTLVHSVPGRPSGWSITETFRGGTARPVGQERGAAGVSSFIGNDPTRWRRELPTYEQLGLGDVWPGITVALRGRGRSIEKIFTVAPGASADRIRVRVGGARALKVDAQGALVARTGLGDVTFTAPVAYQERDGVRHRISVAYRLRGREYRFSVGAYDAGLPLVIDPLLQSTYLGGSSSDSVDSIAIHPVTGDVYVAGTTHSTNFPGTGGGVQAAFGGFPGDAFIARLNSSLTTLTQATYLGGSGDDKGVSLAIHPMTGDVYVAGTTSSTNFPTTAGGAQAAFGGGSTDGFIARLSSSLTTLTQASYLGGGGSDSASGLAIHPTTGDVYVAGSTGSVNFPRTGGGAQAAFGGSQSDAFVVRLSSSLTAFTQTTYLGGSGSDSANAVAIHPMTGDVYVTGGTESVNFPGTPGGAQTAAGNAFIARLNSGLTALTQATYFQGTAALAIHPITGDVYVAGSTRGTDLPGTAGGAQPASGGGSDGFIARLSSSLATLLQATYLGAIGDDSVFALVIHPTTGDVYVAGYTFGGFPGTQGGAQEHFGGLTDAFIARLNSSLTALFQSSYLGGIKDDIAAAVAFHPTTGDAYVAGGTCSTNFPGTAGGAQAGPNGFMAGFCTPDGFVARLTQSLSVADGADLTVIKTHSGDFFQGQLGASYTITVSNIGALPTDGTTVTVTDALPAGLTASALDGPGWSCTLATLTCTRSEVLANGASYPAITLTVDVATSAAGAVTNSVTVSGGGDASPGNNTDTDPTTVVPTPDLAIAKTHAGDFFRGQNGASYTITVANVGGAATAGAVTVTDTLPAGLIATALSGSGWSCTLGTLTCTRSDALASGSSYAAIGLTVNVAGTAPTSIVNTVTVSGGSEVNNANNVANDPTTVAFTDVPSTYPFFAWIAALLNAGITTGCSTSPPLFCPEAGVTRGQMAVFLLRGIHGAGYLPPPPSGIFADVLLDHPFAAWAEQLFVEDVTGGCGTNPLRYCPDDGVTRAQMAVFLLRSKHGAGYQPPDATGLFADVSLFDPFAPWIEQLAREGITGGCATGPPRYCPSQLVTRGQVAVFLVRAFGLPL